MSTFDNAIPQRFPFKTPLMNYIMSPVNGKILKKLHKTCKYFYVKCNYTILDFFALLEKIYPEDKLIEDYKISIDKKEINLLKNNLIVLNYFWLLGCPQIIPKIVECQIFDLIVFCKISMEDLKFLVKAGNIVRLELYEKMYYSETSIEVYVDEIFALCPKATHVT